MMPTRLLWFGVAVELSAKAQNVPKAVKNLIKQHVLWTVPKVE